MLLKIWKAGKNHQKYQAENIKISHNKKTNKAKIRKNIKNSKNHKSRNNPQFPQS